MMLCLLLDILKRPLGFQLSEYNWRKGINRRRSTVILCRAVAHHDNNIFYRLDPKAEHKFLRMKAGLILMEYKALLIFKSHRAGMPDHYLAALFDSRRNAFNSLSKFCRSIVRYEHVGQAHNI